MVSGLMLSSLNHLELNFVQSEKYGSLLIILQVATQSEQYHLLKMLSFLLYIFLM